MNVDRKVTATDAEQKHLRIRGLRDPNPMKEVPDQDSAKNHKAKLTLMLLTREILAYINPAGPPKAQGPGEAYCTKITLGWGTARGELHGMGGLSGDTVYAQIYTQIYIYTNNTTGLGSVLSHKKICPTLRL